MLRVSIAAVLAPLSVNCLLAQDTRSDLEKKVQEEQRVTLTPFEVRDEKDTGFAASSSLAGGRISTALKDTPVAYSVLTAEFLDAFNITNVAEAANWSVNTNFTMADGTAYGFGGNAEAHQILKGLFSACGWKTYLHRKKKGTKCEAQTKRDCKR